MQQIAVKRNKTQQNEAKRSIMQRNALSAKQRSVMLRNAGELNTM
jgi:hypothetical protein